MANVNLTEEEKKEQPQNGIVTNVDPATNTIVSNVTAGAESGYGDWINNGEQTVVPGTTPTTTPTTATGTTPTTTPGTTPKNTPTNGASTGNVTANGTSDSHIMGFEEYNAKENETLGTIYNEKINAIDKATNDALTGIDQSLASANESAGKIKETTQSGLLKEKEEVYAFADELLAQGLAYNEAAYNTLVKSITDQMNQGKISAKEAKDLLMIISEEEKNTSYAAAERNRAEAEKQADINRQRAITDANSAYEQNKAGYGANAEAMARMGLSGGGYSDWVNASAYAQQRSEVQNARAQSDAAKRQAKYTEDMSKLEADQRYTDKKYQAESDYNKAIQEIDTTYATNMTNAELGKLEADNKANMNAAETKRNADSAYNAGMTQSEVTYEGQLYENTSKADEQKLQINQSAEAQKAQAKLDYLDSILGNEKELAEWNEMLKANEGNEENTKKAVLEKLLVGTRNGTYTAEAAAAIAGAFGLKEEWQQAISESAAQYQEEVTGEQNKSDAATKTANFTNLLSDAKNGKLSAEEIISLATQYGFDINDPEDKVLIDLLTKAADGYESGVKEMNAKQKSSTFINLVEMANNGTFNAEQISEIANQLGFDINDSEDKRLIDLLTKAADGFASEEEAAKLKSDTDYMNGMYVELLGAAKNGEFTEEEIRNIASKFGFDGKDLDDICNAAKAAEDKAKELEENLVSGESASNKNYLKESGYITSDTTDEEIDEYVEDGLLTQEDADKLKKYRDEEAVKELKNMTSSGDYTGAIERAEELLQRGVISEDTYQNTHFEVHKNNITQVNSIETFKDVEAMLKNAYNAGDISKADYNELTKYLYSTVGGTLSTDSYGFTSNYKEGLLKDKEEITIELDGTKYAYTAKSNKTADDDTTDLLNKITTDKDKIVMYGGAMYVRCFGDQWCQVDSKNYHELFDAFSGSISRAPEIKAPEHKQDLKDYGSNNSSTSAGPQLNPTITQATR